MEKKLRRFQNTLEVTGLGIFVFGLWSVVKTVLYFLMDSSDMREFLSGIDPEGLFYTLPGMSILTIILLIDIAFRYYIFRSAKMEARGKKKKWLYLLMTCVLVFSSASSIYSYAVGSYIYDPVDAAVSCVVELTAIITSLEMIGSALMVKHLSYKIAKQKQAG